MPPEAFTLIALLAVVLVAKQERQSIYNLAWPTAHAVNMPPPAMGADCFICPPQPGLWNKRDHAERGNHEAECGVGTLIYGDQHLPSVVEQDLKAVHGQALQCVIHKD